MSGGSMDYVSSRIDDAADFIQRTLADEDFRNRAGRHPSIHETYVKDNPDVEYLKDPESLHDEVVRKLRDALICVRKAAIYARRVEWLTSGDDGYEAFCLTLDKKLNECDKYRGVE